MDGFICWLNDTRWMCNICGCGSQFLHPLNFGWILLQGWIYWTWSQNLWFHVLCTSSIWALKWRSTCIRMEMHQDNSATYLDLKVQHIIFQYLTCLNMSKHVTDMEKEWFFLLAGRQQLESFLKLCPSVVCVRLHGVPWELLRARVAWDCLALIWEHLTRSSISRWMV